MNLPYFISKRIHRTSSNSFSSAIYSIAVASIAIGVAIILISYLILGGFQDTIKGKIFSFASHLQITKYTFGNSFQEDPITTNTSIYQNPDSIEFIDHVQEFSHKGGLLKTDTEVQGVVFKGVGPGYDTSRFNSNMVEGRFIEFSDSSYTTEVVLSRKIANKLLLKVGDEVIMYFIQNPPRFRKLTVSGLYDTGLEDFDDRVIIGDIGLVQRLNDWPDTLVGGYEIFVKDIGKIDEAKEKLKSLVPYDMYVEKISDKYLQIFDWLSLLNRNVVIFLSLILFVASFNMISILLILIMERTQMIGVLKAIGATNRQIRSIFIYNGMLMIFKGLVIGNAIGLGFGFLQKRFKFIPLDPENYYMSFVPISWDWPVIIILNLITFITVTLVLLIPTIIIARINPIKAIHFD